MPALVVLGITLSGAEYIITPADSLSKAVNKLKPGDILTLKEGVYRQGTVTSSIKGSAAKYVVKAEKMFEGTQRGGEKFEWAVDSLYILLPVPVRAFITKDMIAEIIQGAFDAMAEYATTQLDKALSDKEV